MEGPEALSPDRIAAGLQTRIVGRRVFVYPTAASTNDLAWGFAGQSEMNGLCLFAEEQTAGRGRLGRRWISARGQSLLFSVLLIDYGGAAEALTLAVAVAVADTLRETTPVSVSIKWPNDILLNGKKACGILVEGRRAAGRPCFVIGIGLNVLQDAAFFERAGLDAASIRQETGTLVNRNKLAGKLLAALDQRLRQALSDPQTVITDWKRYNHQIGRRIDLRQGHQAYHGTCLGIDPLEGLIVQLDGGPIRFFTAAATSVIQ
jgi:BirA family biotin operon repressor/biotin-[acetyl-CoA-carboxylase] ligase